MLNVSSLESVLGGIESNLKKMQAVITPAERRINEITERHGHEYKQEVINKKISEARAEVSDQLYKIYGEINAAAGEAAKSEKYYKSTAYMMSRVKFSDDDGIDAQVRMSKLLEFENMDIPELHLAGEAAKSQKKLPILWLAHIVSRKKGDAKDMVSLEGVQTVEQVAGLALLKRISEGRAKAELMMRGSVISPTPLQPRDKLRLAREAGIP